MTSGKQFSLGTVVGLGAYTAPTPFGEFYTMWSVAQAGSAFLSLPASSNGARDNIVVKQGTDFLYTDASVQLGWINGVPCTADNLNYPTASVPIATNEVFLFEYVRSEVDTGAWYQILGDHALYQGLGFVGYFVALLLYSGTDDTTRLGARQYLSRKYALGL